jgi:predicted transcriptional regulator
LQSHTLHAEVPEKLAQLHDDLVTLAEQEVEHGSLTPGSQTRKSAASEEIIKLQQETEYLLNHRLPEVHSDLPEHVARVNTYLSQQAEPYTM